MPQASCSSSPLYAVIDLGSNSFHMLITRLVANSVQTVDKVKRKVRLASGLDANNQLSEEAMARGLECLSFFAERLQDIAPENIRVVGTATLRIATNAKQFLARAEQALGHRIQVLTGKEEAERIYLGVAHTSDSRARRLVLDIGGASTEIVVGGEFDMDKAISLDMGCVTFNNTFFKQGELNNTNFDAAIAQAKKQLAPVKDEFIALGWQLTLGGSGTMQALAEMLMSKHQPAIITDEFMRALKTDLIKCKNLSQVQIDGLLSERVPVIASGLSILIALFETFSIKQMQLSSGAIREGLLYEMLPDMRKINIRQRTINSLTERFHIDTNHANRVAKQAMYLYQQHAKSWQIDDPNLASLLAASCQLHEVGLLLSYKYHAQHSAYILNHADLPGFDQTERQLIVTLVQNYKGDIQPQQLANLALVSEAQAKRLLIIIRLAVILCRRRKDQALPAYQTNIADNSIALFIQGNGLQNEWLKQHPLMADELMQENSQLKHLGYSLAISC